MAGQHVGVAFLFLIETAMCADRFAAYQSMSTAWLQPITDQERYETQVPVFSCDRAAEAPDGAPADAPSKRGTGFDPTSESPMRCLESEASSRGNGCYFHES